MDIHSFLFILNYALLRFLEGPHWTVVALALAVKLCPGDDSPHAPQELPPPLVVVRHDALPPQRLPRHVQLLERGARQAAGQDLRDLGANSIGKVVASAFAIFPSMTLFFIN